MTQNDPAHSSQPTFSVRDKLVVVVGLGTSGQAAVELLLREGARVVATDRADAQRFGGQLTRFAQAGVQVVVGSHDGVPFTSADLVVVSPGVPDVEPLCEARQAGVEVIGETELAFRFLGAPLYAVGGTNGKSTATTLLGHIVGAADERVFVGGNLGEPACEAPGQGVEVAVWEVSSFQMERVQHFRPKVAILLNISEDHLDRYSGFDAYAEAKGNCFQRQLESDFAVYPKGDEVCARQVSRGKGLKVSFGPGGDYEVEEHEVVERSTGERFDLSSTDLHGGHNYLNAAAVIAAARCVNIDTTCILEGLHRFRALQHRMGLAGKYRNVVFYNDSKATNVGAAVTALSGLTEPAGVLIAGGRDKLGDYSSLVEAIRRRARAVVLLGEAAPRLREAIGDAAPVEVARTIQGAVVRAYKLARPGDAVLLSPACSSLDMFKNYAERGIRFTEAVENLARLLEESPR